MFKVLVCDWLRLRALQSSIISHFTGERSFSVIGLRESANEELRRKLAEAESKVSELDAARSGLEDKLRDQ